MQFAGNVPTFFVRCLQQTTGEISELLRLLNHFSGPQAHLGIEAFRQLSIILLCLLQVGYVDAGWVKEQNLIFIIPDRVEREVDQALGSVCPGIGKNLAVGNALRRLRSRGAAMGQ